MHVMITVTSHTEQVMKEGKSPWKSYHAFKITFRIMASKTRLEICDLDSPIGLQEIFRVHPLPLLTDGRAENSDYDDNSISPTSFSYYVVA